MSRKMTRLRWEQLTEDQRYSEYCEVADQYRTQRRKVRQLEDQLRVMTKNRDTLDTPYARRQR
jgi:hypothetical protein